MGLFKAQLSTSKIKQLTSILVGADYLRGIGVYGHYYKNEEKGDLFSIRTGFANEESRIFLELASIYNKGDDEFLNIIEESRNAA